MNIPVTVTILTHNEEANLPACLESVVEFDDVRVLDSGSTDRTLELATAAGVMVAHNPFQGFGEQRNWATDNIPAKYDWQFHMDADERMTPALIEEITTILATEHNHGGFYVPSKLIFAGKWLKRAGQYPAYQVRLFHKDRLCFENYGHGQREVTSQSIGILREPIIHYGFSKGLDTWFIKHVRYARSEAEQVFHYGTSGGNLFSLHATKRRRGLKRFTSRLPGRYVFRLIYMLFVQRAILDGWAGITYSQMVATYESMNEIYLRLLHQRVDLDRFEHFDRIIPKNVEEINF